MEQSRPAIDRAKDGVLAGPWWRVLSMAAPGMAGSAEDDYAAIRPAALAAATTGCPLVVAWLSRGDGADLELIAMAPTPAAPARRGKHAAPASASVASAPAAAGPGSPVSPAATGGPLLFPPGARAEPARDCADELEQLVWAPCLAGPASPSEPLPDPAEAAEGPGVFETALIALMRRPFGWLGVAEPTDLLAAETAGLRTELEILRRHTERRATGSVEQTERRLAERGTFGAAGLWRVQVLAGAASPGELDVLAPLLAGAAELGPHPYRLRHTTGAHSLAAALAARHHDPADGAQAPFFVTAGTLTALAGLPRVSLPGLELVPRPGDDRTAELLAAPGAADPEPATPEPETPAAPDAPGVYEVSEADEAVGATGAFESDGFSEIDEPSAVDGSLGEAEASEEGETRAAPMVMVPWDPDLNGHAETNGNGSHNGHTGPAGPDPDGPQLSAAPAELTNPDQPPSVNKAAVPAHEEPVPDVTGRMVDLGAPAHPGAGPVRRGAGAG